jgi:hypothetical protein
MKGSFLSRAARRLAILGSAIALSAGLVATASAAGTLPAGASPNGEVSPGILKSANIHFAMPVTTGHKQSNKFSNKGVPGLNSIVNFTSSFNAQGVDPNGNPQTNWPFAMVGRAPPGGQETDFRAPIVPVVLDLLDANGHIVMEDDPRNFIDPVTDSPVFTPAQWFSGFGQFTDADLRSEFFNVMGPGYHNVLLPAVQKPVHMPIPFGEYVFAPNSDGSCCLFVLVDINTFINGFLPATTATPATIVGAAELNGTIKTKDIPTFLFKDVYLFEGGNPNNCCVLGFHTVDVEPEPANSNLQDAFIVIYASWITNGLFNGGFEDITALSHEMAETFNDPFGNNVTPWWLSGTIASGNFQCQDVLEVGDVIEVLNSNTVFSKQMPDGHTYHPQNVALLQWFEFLSPSDAQHQAYSFPDETTLTALSPFEPVNCGISTSPGG